jgi:hypothetical protein
LAVTLSPGMEGGSRITPARPLTSIPGRPG